MRQSVSGVGVALCAVTLSVPAFAEDLTVVSAMTRGKTFRWTSTEYISANKIRTSGYETDTIMDIASGRVTVIEHKTKAYWECSFDDWPAAMAKLQEAMKAMFPTKPIEKIGEVTVTKGASPKKVAGYDTEHWIVANGEAMGDGLRYEIWVAPALVPPTRYYAYEAMSASDMDLSAFSQRFVKVFEAIRKIKGLPLAMTRTKSFANRGQREETSGEATEVRKGPIAASAFQVPAGYKKQESMLAKLLK